MGMPYYVDPPLVTIHVSEDGPMHVAGIEPPGRTEIRSVKA